MSLESALIGATGFVGSSLKKQARFAAQYDSASIAGIAGRAFDVVVCAGAPAKKWLANREPDSDRANLQSLMGHLRRVSCRQLVLISTVDVFAHPVGVNEESPVERDGLSPYGLHRRELELFVEQHFSDSLIVRLPGLVGPGLRKNVVFDLLNDNALDAVDARAVFQFYPMVDLWPDIGIALEHRLRLVHLTAEPVSVGEIARDGFGIDFSHTLPATPARYDLRSLHAGLFGGRGAYQYSKQDSIQAIRAYAQSEPRSVSSGSSS